MHNTNKYQLFISNKCNCCNDVIHELELNKLTIPIINIDTETYNLPFNLMIVPALIKEEKIIAYGANDILKHLNNKPNYRQGKRTL